MMEEGWMETERDDKTWRKKAARLTKGKKKILSCQSDALGVCVKLCVF